MKKHSPKIFIMDDDKFFANILKNYLNNQNMEDVHVFHVELDLLKNLPEEPDLIIMDHTLENTTGLEMIEIIKRAKPRTQFIYLSAQEFYHIAIKAMKLGAIDYIEKNQRSFDKLKSIIDKINTTTNHFEDLSTIPKLRSEILAMR